MKENFSKKKTVIAFNFSIVFIILLLAVSIAINSQNIDSINYYVKNYQYAKALELIETEKDNSDETLNLKASLYKNLHKYHEAIENYKFLYQKDTANIRLIVDMSGCYEAINDYETSQSLLNIAVELDSTNFFVIQKLGDSYYKSQKPLHAINTYLYAEQIDSSYYLARQLALCYESILADTFAIVYYKKALNFNPNDFRSLLRMVNIYRNQKEFDTALVITDNYLLRDSLNTKVLQMSGILNYTTGRFGGAIRRMQKCLELKDSADMVIKYLGYSHFKRKEYDLAYNYLAYTCAKELNNPDAHYMAGMAFAMTGKADIGIIYMEIALDILTAVDSSYMSKFYYDLATTRQKNYQWRQAITDFEKSFSYNPESEDYLKIYEIARIYDQNLKNRKKAIEFYSKSLKLIAGDTEIEKIFKNSAESRIQRLREEEFMEGR